MNDQYSPYTPPKSHVEAQPPESIEVVPAGKGLRIANLFIDYIGLMILGLIIGLATYVLFEERGLAYLESIPDLIYGAVLTLMYYVTLEATTGRTLGKLITGTRVVNEDGLPASLGQIVGRSFARMIPFEAFSFLIIDNGRGWHDSIPKTYVVKVR